MRTLPSGITRVSGTTYDILGIDLGIARTDAEVEIIGDVISVIEITGELDVKLNEKDEPAIELDKVSRAVIKPAKFTKLFFTNIAQTGKSATLYIGREASFIVDPKIVGTVGLLDKTDTRIDPATEDSVKTLRDDTIKGVLRSVGDAGTTPANVSGRTILAYLDGIYLSVIEIRRRRSYEVEKYTVTTTPLGANASFTSSWWDYAYTLYAHLMYLCYSDVDGTMYSQFSHDKTIVIREDSLSYTGGSKTGNLIDTKILAKWVRIRYVNGAVAQTVFALTWSRSD